MAAATISSDLIYYHAMHAFTVKERTEKAPTLVCIINKVLKYQPKSQKGRIKRYGSRREW